MNVHKRKGISILMMAIMLLVGLLTGCGSTEQAVTSEKQAETNGAKNTSASEPAKKEKRTIKHELGETEITGTPQRVVALEYSFVDALASLGVSPVGIADDNDPSSIIEPIKKVIGEYTSVGSRYETNLELISSLKPDLIIGDIKRHKEVYEELKKIAPTILLDSFGADYKANLASLPVIADAVGSLEAADKRLSEHEAKINELKSMVPKDETRTVLPAVVNEKGFWGHSSKAYAGSLMEHLGLKDAVQSEEAYNKMTLEQLVEFNPDILFLMNKPGDKSVIDEWKNNPLWQQVSAVKNGHVYEVDRALWSLSRGLISAETISEEALTFLYGKQNK